MPPSDVYRILVEFDRSKSKTEAAAFEKDLRNLGASFFGPQGFSVGQWEEIKKGIDPLIANIKKLEKAFKELEPQIRAAHASFNRLGKEVVKEASQMETLRGKILRNKIATQQLQINKERLALSTTRLSRAYIEHETASKRNALAAVNLERAQLRLKISLEEYNSSKDREMIRLAKNENLLLRNALMQQKLSGAVDQSSVSVGRFRTILRSMAEQHAWVEKLLSRFAKFGPVIAKATSMAQRFGSAIRRAVTAPIRGLRWLTSGFGGLAARLGIIISLAYTMRMAWRSVMDLWKLGIQTLDTLQLKAASMAGAMLIADPKMDFSQALGQADQLLLKSFALSREFVGSARELQVLMEAMATFGVKIDLTTEKGRKSFVAFANTLKLITQGQNFEIQAFQEIRALMQGQNFQGAMLARRMQALGIDVKKMVPIWTKKGILLEKIVELMGGYAQATEAIKNTLYSQRKLTESIVSLMLKEGLQQAYDDIKATLIKINWYLLGNVTLTDKARGLAAKIHQWWVRLRNALLDALPYFYALYKIFLLIVAAAQKIQDALFGSLGLLGKLIRKVASVFKPVEGVGGPFADLRDAWNATYDYLIGDMHAFTKELRLMYDEQERDRQAAIARSARYIYDAKGRAIGVEYETPPAESPPASHVPMETEAMNFAIRLQSFINKTYRDINASVGKMGEGIATKIASARAKVENEFSKWFDNKYLDSIKEKKPLLYKALQLAHIDSLANAQATEIREWKIKIEDEVVALNHSLDQLFDQHLQQYDDVDEGLQKKYRQIDKTINDQIHKLDQTLLELIAGVAGPGEAGAEGTMAWLPKEVFEVVDLIKKMFTDMKARAEEYREQMKAAAETQYLREHLAYVSAIREELENMAEAAKIPAKWSWNEEEVDRAEKLANNMEKIDKQRVKLSKDYAKYKLSPEEYLELWEKTEKNLEAMNKKVIEETEFTTKVASDAWKEFFGGVGTVAKQFFSDALRLELKSFFDYFASFSEMLLDVWANMLGKMVEKAAEKLMGGAMEQVFDDFMGLFKGLNLSALKPAAASIPLIGRIPLGPGMAFMTAEGGVLPGPFVPIKAFAGGGIVDRPMLGMVGEGGGPEAVIPLKGGNVPVKLLGDHRKELAGSGSPQPVNINFQIIAADTRDFDRLLYERKNMITGMIRQEIRNAGGSRDMIMRHAR